MCSYNLEYKDYSTNVSDGLRSLYSTLDIADITLAVEGKLFKAHQVILSIFSPYFREIFCQNSSKQTVIFMKGVKHRIMKDLLVFMYEGKVEIHGDDFNLFVETARELKIKGLTNEQDGAQVETVSAENLRSESANEEMSAIKRQLASPLRSAESEEDRKRSRPPNESASNQPQHNLAAQLSLPAQHNLPPQINHPAPHNLPQVSVSNNLLQSPPTNITNSMYLNQIQSQLSSMAPQIATTMAPPMAMPSTSWMQMPGMPATDHIITPDINIKLEKRDDGHNKLEIGPTEVHYDGTKDDSMELYEIDDNEGHEVEDHFMAGEVELHEGRGNIKLEANHSLVPMQPKIAEGEPVPIILCKSKKTSKVNALKWQDHRFSLKSCHRHWTAWVCSRRDTRKCPAKVILTDENRLVSLYPHSHSDTKTKHLQRDDFISCIYYWQSVSTWSKRPNARKMKSQLMANVVEKLKTPS